MARYRKRQRRQRKSKERKRFLFFMYVCVCVALCSLFYHRRCLLIFLHLNLWACLCISWKFFEHTDLSLAFFSLRLSRSLCISVVLSYGVFWFILSRWPLRLLFRIFESQRDVLFGQSFSVFFCFFLSWWQLIFTHRVILSWFGMDLSVCVSDAQCLQWAS